MYKIETSTTREAYIPDIPTSQDVWLLYLNDRETEIDNPQMLATLGTQDIERRQPSKQQRKYKANLDTTQKKMSNTDTNKTVNSI